MTAQSHDAGVPKDKGALANWDLLAEIMREAKEQGDSSIGPALEGLSIRRNLAEGDVAAVIVQTAEEEKADLIMMPSHGFTFYNFLLGSVTAKVLHGTERPVWTGAHTQESPGQKFAIHNVLGAVEFGPRAEVTVSWAAQMAAEFGARLTLAYVTASVEFWGRAATTSTKSGKRSWSAMLPRKCQSSSRTRASRQMYSSAVGMCPKC